MSKTRPEPTAAEEAQAEVEAADALLNSELEAEATEMMDEALANLLERLKPQKIEAGQVVRPNKGRHKGRTTGHSKACTMEGCSGTRVRVVWPGNRITWPCTKGMDYDEKTKSWKIL